MVLRCACNLRRAIRGLCASLRSPSAYGQGPRPGKPRDKLIRRSLCGIRYCVAKRDNCRDSMLGSRAPVFPCKHRRLAGTTGHHPALGLGTTGSETRFLKSHGICRQSRVAQRQRHGTVVAVPEQTLLLDGLSNRHRAAGHHAWEGPEQPLLRLFFFVSGSVSERGRVRPSRWRRGAGSAPGPGARRAAVRWPGRGPGCARAGRG